MPGILQYTLLDDRETKKDADTIMHCLPHEEVLYWLMKEKYQKEKSWYLHACRNLIKQKEANNTGNDNKPIIAVNKSPQQLNGILFIAIPLVRMLRMVEI